MNTFLFLWNPKKWNWSTFENDLEQVERTGHCPQRWSCGNTRSIKPGDRIFLLKLGYEPKGIIGAGFATSAPFYDSHWSGANRRALYVEIDFETLIDPSQDSILTVDVLKSGNLYRQNWQPMASGISIRRELVNELEALWFEFLINHDVKYNPFIPNENEAQKTYSEGTPNQVSITKYERNPHARKKCLDYYGYNCVVCDFNFEKHYGIIGRNFIHVHHLTQLANIGNTYEIDPIKDLRPVCPNCHSMIHSQSLPLSIDEMKLLMEEMRRI